MMALVEAWTSTLSVRYRNVVLTLSAFAHKSFIDTGVRITHVRYVYLESFMY